MKFDSSPSYRLISGERLEYRQRPFVGGQGQGASCGGGLRGSSTPVDRQAREAVKLLESPCKKATQECLIGFVSGMKLVMKSSVRRRA